MFAAVERAAALEGEDDLARQGLGRLGRCGCGASGKRHVHGYPFSMNRR
jgi:hypothetical protein